MFAGSVESIFLHAGTTGGEPMVVVSLVPAEQGGGLVGDRFWQGPGSTALRRGVDREVTLIEPEAIEAVTVDGKLTLSPATCRRDSVTRGVVLNHLVHRDFRVGSAILRGLRLCELCKHLEQMAEPGMLMALLHRGGLRAQVIETDEVRLGDLIQPLNLEVAIAALGHS